MLWIAKIKCYYCPNDITDSYEVAVLSFDIKHIHIVEAESEEDAENKIRDYYNDSSKDGYTREGIEIELSPQIL